MDGDLRPKALKCMKPRPKSTSDVGTVVVISTHTPSIVTGLEDTDMPALVCTGKPMTMGQADLLHVLAGGAAKQELLFAEAPNWRVRHIRLDDKQAHAADLASEIKARRCTW